MTHREATATAPVADSTIGLSEFPRPPLLGDVSDFNSFGFAKTPRRHAMVWTGITRSKYRRDELRYASDTTDAEWAVIAPLLPPPANSGRTRKTNLREVVNGVFYIVHTPSTPSLANRESRRRGRGGRIPQDNVPPPSSGTSVGWYRRTQVSPHFRL
jgi:hypothetical protein